MEESKVAKYSGYLQSQEVAKYFPPTPVLAPRQQVHRKVNCGRGALLQPKCLPCIRKQDTLADPSWSWAGQPGCGHPRGAALPAAIRNCGSESLSTTTSTTEAGMIAHESKRDAPWKQFWGGRGERQKVKKWVSPSELKWRWVQSSHSPLFGTEQKDRYLWG